MYLSSPPLPSTLSSRRRARRHLVDRPQRRQDLLELLIPRSRPPLALQLPPQPLNLPPDSASQRRQHAERVLERPRLLPHVLDAMGEQRRFGGPFLERVEDEAGGGAGVDGVHDGEGELAFGDVFGEPLVVGVLRGGGRGREGVSLG